jgi:hypothetical protein
MKKLLIFSLVSLLAVTQVQDAVAKKDDSKSDKKDDKKDDKKSDKKSDGGVKNINLQSLSNDQMVKKLEALKKKHESILSDVAVIANDTTVPLEAQFFKTGVSSAEVGLITAGVASEIAAAGVATVALAAAVSEGPAGVLVAGAGAGVAAGLGVGGEEAIKKGAGKQGGVISRSKWHTIDPNTVHIFKTDKVSDSHFIVRIKGCSADGQLAGGMKKNKVIIVTGVGKSKRKACTITDFQVKG